MTSIWQPFRESVRSTLTRTVLIAVVVGGVLAAWRGGGLKQWPVASLVVLWLSLGGHLIEIAFLNGIRPRIAPQRAVQVAARIAIWFAGGALLAIGMGATAAALAGVPPERWPAWWVGGAAFIGVELVAHVGLQLRRRPSFYDGRG